MSGDERESLCSSPSPPLGGDILCSDLTEEEEDDGATV